MDAQGPNSSPLEILKEKSRQLSLACLKSHSSLENLSLANLAQLPIVPGHWMAIVLASSKELRFTFKVYFMTRDIEILARSTYAGKAMSPVQVTDFLKEYCNLTVGSLKRFLEQSKVELGVSLPVATRGFDEVFSRPSPGHQTTIDFWLIEGPGLKLHCSIIYEFFQNFQIVEDQSESATGVVDFL